MRTRTRTRDHEHVREQCRQALRDVLAPLGRKPGAVRAAFGAAGDAMADLGDAALVHGDFHFGSLLIEDGRITALLDPEWSRARDPLEDLCIAAEVEQFCTGSRAPRGTSPAAS